VTTTGCHRLCAPDIRHRLTQSSLALNTVHFQLKIGVRFVKKNVHYRKRTHRFDSYCGLQVKTKIYTTYLLFNYLGHWTNNKIYSAHNTTLVINITTRYQSIINSLLSYQNIVVEKKCSIRFQINCSSIVHNNNITVIR